MSVERIKELIKLKEKFPRSFDISLHKKYLAIEEELDELIFKYLQSKGVKYHEDSYKLIRELVTDGKED